MIQLNGEAFKTQDIPATVYHSGLLGKFGAQMYAWDPETLGLEIASAYVIPVDDILTEVKDKINAVCAVNHIDTPYLDCAVFRSVILALNHVDPQFQTAGGLDAPELAWGLLEISHNAAKMTPWSEEVKRYVSICLEHEHFLSVPESISERMKFSYHPQIDSQIAALPEVLLEEQIRQKRVEVYMAHETAKLKDYLEKFSV